LEETTGPKPSRQGDGEHLRNSGESEPTLGVKSSLEGLPELLQSVRHKRLPTALSARVSAVTGKADTRQRTAADGIRTEVDRLGQEDGTGWDFAPRRDGNTGFVLLRTSGSCQEQCEL
jgi:hypothetical protein